MNTDAERKAFIKNEDNWHQISNLGNVRTFELKYKHVSTYRQESFRNEKWRKDYWYRFGPGYKPVKMDIHQFIKFLEEIDRQRPDQGGNA